MKVKLNQKENAQLAPKTFEHIACPICQSSLSKTLTKKGQFDWENHVVICKNCGFVYENPRWTAQDFDYFYTKEYDQFYRFDENVASQKEQKKSKKMWGRIKQYINPEFHSVLDVGCGLGWSLAYISSQVEGLRIAGIEPSDVCADYLVNKIGAELIDKDVNSDWHIRHTEQFDLIIMRHTLEHLLNPLEVLEQVRTALSPSGIFYVAIPDMMHPAGSLNQYWYRNVHVSYFSDVTLTRLAVQAGLTPIFVTSDGPELWGVFRKTTTPMESASAFTSVYQRQLLAIYSYQVKRALFLIFSALFPQKAFKLVPKAVKNFFPEKIKEKVRKLG